MHDIQSKLTETPPPPPNKFIETGLGWGGEAPALDLPLDTCTLMVVLL